MNTPKDTLPFKVMASGPYGETVQAAFANKEAHDAFRARCYQTTPDAIVDALVHEAISRSITIEGNGTQRDVLATVGALPYEELLLALQRGVAVLGVFKNHQHHWEMNPVDGIDYCCICSKPRNI